MMRCPSELELERHLLDPERSTIGPHLATCSRCRAEIAEMRRLGLEFQTEVFPRTIDAVVARITRTSPPRWRWLAAVPVSVAAAAVVLLMIRPASDYVGTKGDDLRLSVFVAGPAGVISAASGDTVPARSALRFQVRATRPCRLWLVSVDGAGQVSRLFPAEGAAGEAPAAAETLPGGAVLDGRPGPERIFVVCSPAPLPYEDVERAARGAAAGGDAAVRSVRTLRGLPRDALQATLLLEKRP